MFDTTLLPDAERLTRNILMLRQEREAEFKETENRLKELEKELSVMDKSDLRENAPYQIAKDEQAMLYAKITNLHNAIEALNRETGAYTPTGIITLGTTVHLRILDIDGGRPNVSKLEHIIKIVEHDTSSAKIGLVAKDSRVGLAILGRTAGDIVTVTAAKGCVKYKIERIY